MNPGRDSTASEPDSLQNDDWHLIERAQAGDMEAFAGLVRKYEQGVIQFCWRMAGSRDDAEELAQDSFVRVYRHLHRLTPRAKFSTLLFGIARNLTLNHLRNMKRRGRGRTVPLDEGPAMADTSTRPDRNARLGEMASLIEQGLARLTPAYREVLILRELNGMDYASIAQVMKCRKGTVKSRIARAREQLRQEIRALAGDEI